MIKKSNGFTVIELIFIVVIFGLASVVFFVQKSNLKVESNDSSKKIAINAMYYSLEEVFYAKNGYYPQTIDSTVLPSVDPDLFTDPSGIKINESDSAYTYSPVNCTDNKCKKYTLKADLQKEDDYTKSSKN